VHVPFPAPSSQNFKIPACTTSSPTPKLHSKPHTTPSRRSIHYPTPGYNFLRTKNRATCLSSAWAHARKSPQSKRLLKQKQKSIWFLTCTAGRYALSANMHSPLPLNSSPSLLSNHILQFILPTSEHPPTTFTTPKTIAYLSFSLRSQSPQILHRQMHRHIVPRSRPQQGRVCVLRPLRRQVFRGQCQG
jgi:hypothetical protein